MSDPTVAEQMTAAVFNEAARLYVQDADFYNLVNLAVEVVAYETGPFDVEQRGIAIRAASVALVLSEAAKTHQDNQPLETITVESVWVVGETGG
jgi:hypothetical protein